MNEHHEPHTLHGRHGCCRNHPAALLPADTTANTDTIPVDQLRERQTGTLTFRPLSAATSLTVAQSDSASAAGGDAVSEDDRVQIPFVTPDTYTGTLNYVLSAQ
jgi:hypothetical protein